MSDDNNDRLMEQFIEKATPKLLEAMTAQITEHVEQQIGGLKSASEKMLDEIKDAKRERDAREKQQADEFSQLKTLIERGDPPSDIQSILTPEPIRLTRAQARDPQLYRRAKAQAEKAGTTLEILADG